MYAGEDGEVCVELGYAGKALSASKAKQPDKSKAGGWPVRYIISRAHGFTFEQQKTWPKLTLLSLTFVRELL